MMKTIKLTKGFEAIVDVEDFNNLVSFKWTAIKKDDGRVYAYRMSRRSYPYEKRHMIFMHREILNAPKNKVVDHRNHNTLDNRRENLRICTHTENMRNRKIQKNNTSGFVGVVYHPQNRFRKWIATIRIGNKWPKFIGSYLTKEEAGEAYKTFALKYHGEYANLKTNETA